MPNRKHRYSTKINLKILVLLKCRRVYISSRIAREQLMAIGYIYIYITTRRCVSLMRIAHLCTSYPLWELQIRAARASILDESWIAGCWGVVFERTPNTRRQHQRGVERIYRYTRYIARPYHTYICCNESALPRRLYTAAMSVWRPITI